MTNTETIKDGARVQYGKKIGTVVSQLMAGGFYVRWDGSKRQSFVAADKLTVIP